MLPMLRLWTPWNIVCLRALLLSICDLGYVVRRVISSSFPLRFEHTRIRQLSNQDLFLISLELVLSSSTHRSNSSHNHPTNPKK